MSEGQENRKDGLFEGGDTTVTLTLDDGRELECVVLTIFTAGSDEREYIALLPAGEDEEDGEVYLYRYDELPDGEPELSNIETDEEYELVSDAFDELLDEQEFDELFDGEEEDGEE